MTLDKRLLRLEAKAGQVAEPGLELERIFYVAEGDGSPPVEVFRRVAGRWRNVQDGEVLDDN